MPVPVSASVVVDGWALLVNVSVALAAPVVVGLKVTVNETLWPAGIVTGSVSPPTVNTELFVLAPVTVTLAPLAVSIPDELPLLPTSTLPRFMVVGLTASCPTAAVPLPESGMVSVGFEASDVIVRLPLALPADDGANETLKVALCPAVRVTGVVIPVKLNPDPLIATCEIVTLVPPLLVMVSDRDCLFPTVTLPKPRLVGLAPSVPGVTPLPDNGMVRVGLEALDVIVRLPLALPADDGVNETLKVALCPAVSVTGVVIPVKLNPDPLIVT